MRKITLTLSIIVIASYITVAILAPFIASDIPIVCVSDRSLSFPILKTHESQLLHITHGKSSTNDCWYALIPYSYKNLGGTEASLLPPLSTQVGISSRFTHWLGTDKIGRDVAAGMIRGTRTAVKIGGFSVLISFLLGTWLGIFAGYFGDNGLKMSLWQLLSTSVFTLLAFFYLYYGSHYLLFLGLVVFGILFHIILSKFALRKKNYNFPIDLIVVKAIEVRKSIPGLFFILAMLIIFNRPSSWNIVIVISLLGWIDFAKLARAETMATKQENYVISARLLGLSLSNILSKQILPNIMPTLWVVACFSLSSAILLESSLSFLGIGLPVEDVSWGKLMNEGRTSQAWWLVVFPGLAIFILVLSLNRVILAIQEKR